MALILLVTAVFFASCTDEAEPERPNLLMRSAEIVVEDTNVPRTLDDSIRIALRRDGVIVNEERSGPESGRLTVRVAADELDDTVREISDGVDEVRSRRFFGEDLLEKHLALQAQITALDQIQQDLARALERDTDLSDAGDIRRELAATEANLAQLQSQLLLLEEQAMTATITVRVSRSPLSLNLIPGADKQVVQDNAVSFSAAFEPPDGINSFQYVWTFGDGSESPVLTATESTGRGAERMTAPVYHTYDTAHESPYRARVSLRGEGEAGRVSGEGSLNVRVVDGFGTLISMPDRFVTRAGRQLRLQADVSLPPNAGPTRYLWDFGDGQPTASGSITADQTTLEVTHAYRSARPEPYRLTLRVTGRGNGAGNVSATAHALVYVDESSAFLPDLSGVLGDEGFGSAVWRAAAAVALVGVLVVGLWSIGTAIVRTARRALRLG